MEEGPKRTKPPEYAAEVHALREVGLRNLEQPAAAAPPPDAEDDIVTLTLKMQENQLERHLTLAKMLCDLKRKKQFASCKQMAHYLKSLGGGDLEVLKTPAITDYIRVGEFIAAYPLMRYFGRSYDELKTWAGERYAAHFEATAAEWALPK